MDFKNLHPKYKSVYFNFIYKLSRLIQSEKLKVSACLNGEDMININNNSFLSATNFEILMPYRWGWIKSPPMPVVPLNQLEKLLHRTVSAFPPKNIMLDLPLFGYDWTLPYHLHKNPAKTVSSNDAINLAVSKNTCIHFDYVSGSPYYNYVDEYNNTHIVWFEDVQSLWVKYELACFMGLKGFSFWLCGYDFL